MAWIAGGHPVLDANALGQEASKNLGLLLNQLRAPEASSLPCLVAIVIINRLLPSSSFCLSSSSILGTVVLYLLEEIKLIVRLIVQPVSICDANMFSCGRSFTTKITRNMLKNRFIWNL
jgi:hypothetical protein